MDMLGNFTVIFLKSLNGKDSSSFTDIHLTFGLFHGVLDFAAEF